MLKLSLQRSTRNTQYEQVVYVGDGRDGSGVKSRTAHAENLFGPPPHVTAAPRLGLPWATEHPSLCSNPQTQNQKLGSIFKWLCLYLY